MILKKVFIVFEIEFEISSVYISYHIKTYIIDSEKI